MKIKKHFFETLKKTIIIISTVIIMFFIIELILQTYFTTPFALFVPNTIYKIQIDSLKFNGIHEDVKVTINSSGYRGQLNNNSDKKKIVTIGGSTTECFLLNEKKTWPSLLEKELNIISKEKIWVGNWGKSGLNTNHHIEQLTTLTPSIEKIDLIILLIGVNDFLRELKYTPNFKALKKSAILHSTYKICDDRFAPFPKNLKLYKLFRGKNTFYFPEKEIEISTNNNLLAESCLKRFEANKITINPDYTEGLNRYEKNIKKIIRLCKKQGSKLVFLTQPSLWKTPMPLNEEKTLWLGAKGNRSDKNALYYHSSVLELGIQIYNNKLKEIASTYEIPVIDLEKSIAKNKANFYDGIHFNEEGAINVSNFISKPIFKILNQDSETNY